MTKPQFQEVQPFWQQPIVWPVWILFAAFVYYLMINQLIYDIVGYILIAVTIAANLLIFIMALETEVSSKGVSYRMRPFHRKMKHHDWSEIEHSEVRKYKPLREYGGYGVRVGMKGNAYTIKGKKGLQLVLKTGKRILIGTQKPELLENTLKQLRKS